MLINGQKFVVRVGDFLLHGRAGERSIIDRLLADARSGRGGALVIHGEPGIGKTALLDYAAAAAGSADAVPTGVAPGRTTWRGARAFRVIRGAGVQAEAELPFASLQLLLGPALARCAGLPQPQREALDAAFGLRRAGPGDRFLTGLAVLALLAELATDGPLLCLVDDAHWLDEVSAELLTFASRRLDSKGIAIIFAARSHDAPLFTGAGLPELQLSALDTAQATMLLTEHTDGSLATGVRDLILAQACGNPLGLIELSAAHRGPSPPTARPGVALVTMTDRLRTAFGGEVAGFPAPTQTILLAAATEDSGDLAAVLEAVKAYGATVADLAPAERAGLVRIVGAAIVFRHPLVRAAVYQSAPLVRRLAMHRAVADAMRDPADVDRRAWHLAAAATGPDEEIAAELARTAARAAGRSGFAAAAACERAVQLTADPAAKAARLALAAWAAAEVGDFSSASAMTEQGARQTADPVVLATLASISAIASFAWGRLPAAHSQLIDAAALAGEWDRPRRVRILLSALQVAWSLGDQAMVTRTAGRLKAASGSSPEPLALLGGLMASPVVPAGELSPGAQPMAAEAVTAARRSAADDPHDLVLIAKGCLAIGRNFDALDLVAGLVGDAHAKGRAGPLPGLLLCMAQSLTLEGRHRDALASATEALEVARDTGHEQWTTEAHALMAYLAAVNGDEDRCRYLAEAALTVPAIRASAGMPWVAWALGLLDLGLGRLDTALIHLEALSLGPWRYHEAALQSIPDLAEAAVRLGHAENASEPLARFSQWAQRAGTLRVSALSERCRALVAPGEHAERHYLAALEMHERSFEQARTQLLYGAWLRRRRRKSDARTQLRSAADYLGATGAVPWAERAQAELTASGITASPASLSGPPRLTPQELQVTRLAAEGLSNRDIAAQLSLSSRTVGYHLYKAYPKLGITSRGELDPDVLARARFASPTRPVASVAGREGQGFG